MKTIFAIFTFFLLTQIPVWAQGQDTSSSPTSSQKGQLIWVRASDIPPSALQSLQRDAKIQRIEKNIEEISQYVGVGKEIGSAIDTSLGALAHHVDKISQTNVGQFAMAMVAWKIIGNDALGYAIRIIAFTLFISLWIWSWIKNFHRRNIPQTVQISPPTWYRPWKKIKIIRSRKYQIDQSDPGGFEGGLTGGQASYLGHIVALVLGLLIIFFAI